MAFLTRRSLRNAADPGPLGRAASSTARRADPPVDRNRRVSTVLALALMVVLAAGGCASAPQGAAPEVVPSPIPSITSSEPVPGPQSVATSEAGATPVEDAANADVEFVRAVRGEDGLWTFHVTVRHPDTGWEDYADGWDVVLPDGSVAKPDPDSPFTRLLLHPHENEQPFTRSQSGIAIPPDVTRVTVRAHDLVDGWGGRELGVDLSVSTGPDFEVER